MKKVLQFLLLLSIASCGQLSSFQTGRTLGTGNSSLGAGVLGYGVQDPDASGGDLGSTLVPHAVIMYQRGLSNRFDLGLKISSGYNVQLHGKFQIIGDQESHFATSLGAGVIYQPTLGVNERVFVYRIHIPLYLSYHFDDQEAIYATPRYIHQFVQNDENSYFVGSSFGYQHRFSDRFAMSMEGSYYLPYTVGESLPRTYIYQFGVGGSWFF